MYSKEELAQPVGKAKIRDEFDADAATAVDPGTNNAALFQRLIGLNPALGREEAFSLFAQGIAQLVLAVGSMFGAKDTAALVERVSGCFSPEPGLVFLRPRMGISVKE